MNFSAMDPSLYDVQLHQKAEKLTSLFSDYSTPELEVFPSPKRHYRMRAEFRVWHDGDDLFYYMFDNIKKQKVRCDTYLPASALINELMPILMAELRPDPVLRHKLFQVDFLSTLSGEILVSLLYHRQLDESWQQHIAQLKAKLSTRFNLHFIGRARKQKITADRDYVIESLSVNHKHFIYKQVENSFTQPNAQVASKMLEWSLDVTQHCSGDLLELYCGNGNFSIALAQNFNQVLATELAKPSVDAAQYNIAANHVDNVTIIRMSAEDFSDAMAKKRAYRRLKDIDLDSYDCNTIFVDPPRAGLDDNTLSLVQQYDQILYISCNPTTLAENLQSLSRTHDISRFALFDQFPYTEHMEAGVLLTRR